MGQITAHNLVLSSGVNTINFTGLLSPPQNSLTAAGIFFSQYFSGMDSIVGVKGIGVESSLGWLKETVERLAMKTTLTGLKKKKLRNSCHRIKKFLLCQKN